MLDNLQFQEIIGICNGNIFTFNITLKQIFFNI